VLFHSLLLLCADVHLPLFFLSPQAESNLARYGRALLTHLPSETTQLLIDLCTISHTTTSSLDLSASQSQNDGLPSALDPPDSAVALKSGIPGNAPSYLSYLNNRGGGGIAGDTATIGGVSAPSVKTVRADGRGGEGGSGAPTIVVNTDLGGAGGDYGLTQTGSPTMTVSAVESAKIGSDDLDDGRMPANTVIVPSRLGGSRVKTLSVPPPKPKLVSPRVYFAHFVDHMEEFVVFLEEVSSRRWGMKVSLDDAGASVGAVGGGTSGGVLDEEDKEDQVAVWNTLLELYLSLPLSSPSSASATSTTATTTQQPSPEFLHLEAQYRSKALLLLKSNDKIPYDKMHALMLCSTRAFTPGLVILWEGMGMYEDVVRFWMDRWNHPSSSASSSDSSSSNAPDEVVKALRKYGPKQPSLYPLVLRFLTSSHELLRRHEGDVKDILKVMDEEGGGAGAGTMGTPLGIVQVLSRNGVASVGLVKEWLMERIGRSQREIQMVGCHFLFVKVGG
jgi:vacuolar protein sorting-associated protein 11